MIELYKKIKYPDFIYKLQKASFVKNLKESLFFYVKWVKKLLGKWVSFGKQYHNIIYYSLHVIKFQEILMHLKINKFLNIESLDTYSIDSSRVATR